MEETQLTGFESLEPLEAASIAEQGFSGLLKQQESYFSEQRKALNTTTLLTALARTDPTKNISYQLGEEALQAAREQLELGNERQIRNDLMREKMQTQLYRLNEITSGLNYAPDPALVKGAQTAYDNVLTWDRERKERTAIEEAAIDRIQTMASTDPVQARVLLDNLEFGNAEETIRQFNVKLSLLRQRAEELDDEYQQSGWGRFLINTVLNFFPTNFNFQRTGIIGTAGIGDLLGVGSAQARESTALWNLPLDEFSDYVAKDGPLMQSIRDNATSIFDMVDDPGAAVEIMDNLISTSDSSREWNNIWGGVEIASAVPWGKLASASRLLVTSGAAKDAVRNLDNAAQLLESRGPEAMTRMTGVTEKELGEELSVSAIKGTDDFVPLSEPVASHSAAARQAAEEIFNSPEMSSFRSMEELQNAIIGRVDELRARVGSPIKDIHMKPVTLPGGRTIYQIVFTVGKKDNFGYATEGAAIRGRKAMGLAGDTFEDAVESVVPVRAKTVKLVEESSVTSGDGLKSYRYILKVPNEEDVPISLTVENGKGTIDIGGMIINKIGPSEMRRIAGQLADEIPELKTLEGVRTTGARKAPEVTSINVENLRGRTETIRDMSGQWFNKITVDMPEAGWLAGKLEPPQQGFVSKMIGRWFQATPRISDRLLHGMSIEAGSYLNRAGRHIDNEVMGVFRNLNGESRKVVGAIGKVQNIRRKWFTPEEIDILVDRQWGRPATEAEHKAIADLRLFNDMDHELHNTAVYLDGVQKGKESVKFTSKWGQEFDEDVIIDYTMDTVPVERVYDISRGKHYVHGRNSLDTKTLTTMRNNGYVMMTFPKGFKMPEGVVVNKVLIKKTDVEIRPLRREQLGYVEGGHTMYIDQYFVKQGRKGVQRDTGSEYLEAPGTFRTAKNMAEGRKWADKMNEARLALKENPGLSAQQIEDEIFLNDQSFPTGQEFLDRVTEGTYNLDHPFEVVFDRELPSMYNQSGEDVTRLFNEDELGINGYYRTTGRMYTSGKGEILRDTKGEVAEILDPFDTLSRSLNQVTRQIGLYNYKMNAMERFANTYKQWLQVDPNLRSSSQVLMEGKVINTASKEIRDQIEAQRAAILNVLRFETPAERASRQSWRLAAESALGTGDNTFRKMIHDGLWWWKNNDPVGALRGLAFDMKLGMFNPAQLLVQASTMISATALSPKFGALGFAGLMPMHAYILKRGSENVLDLMTKRGVWKTMGFSSSDEFKDYARHAYKHGFMEMNGSHIMINNFGPNSHFGSFGEKVSRGREQSRVFFYTAETWNRLVAYRIAWGEATAKGLRPNNPEFNETILRLADDYSFNMTHESAAYWQKGLLSIPTQFWAYNVRMMDAMFGKRFTLQQRIRLMTANVAMAGMAGIPGVQAVSEYIKQQRGESFDIDTVGGAIDRGLIDYINYQMTGNDVVIGERVGTGGWASQVVKSVFGKSEFGEQSFADLVGGATYSIAKNTSKTLYDLARYAAAESGSQTGKPITAEHLINVLREVSTFSNASKAMMIHQYGMYKSNKGTVLASKLPESNALYAALSFRPAKADEIGYMLEWTANREESQKEIAKKLRNWRQEALVTGEYEKYWTKANTLIQLVPIQDRREIIKKTNRIDEESFYDYLEEKVSEEQTMDEAMENQE